MLRGLAAPVRGRWCITMRLFLSATPLLALHRPPTFAEKLRYILDGYPQTETFPDTVSTEGPTQRGRRRRRQQLRSPTLTPPLSPTPLRHPPSPVQSLLGEAGSFRNGEDPLSQWDIPPPHHRNPFLQRPQGSGYSRGPSPLPPVSPGGSGQGDQELPGAERSPRRFALPRGVPLSPRTNPNWFPFSEETGEEEFHNQGDVDSPRTLHSLSLTPDPWVPLPLPEEAHRRRRRPKLKKQHADLDRALLQLGKDAWELKEELEADLQTFFGKLGIAPRRL
ncbi:unnamed protein product [Canis familiaris papillomavirus 10]|uniref:E4 n=1 Tax=Canis familiaris papillomavirus 10 TaxID=1087109 RepID=G4XF73_9PAPI|nr:unnamed protein product [Canis familiaris papillomavirus 10]AEP82745.1 E4 [Canis familiaris papillomavirus 10]